MEYGLCCGKGNYQAVIFQFRISDKFDTVKLTAGNAGKRRGRRGKAFVPASPAHAAEIDVQILATGYSLFRLSTGFVNAAFKVWEPIVRAPSTSMVSTPIAMTVIFTSVR